MTPRLAAAAAVLALAACAGAPPASPPQRQPVITVGADEVLFRGPITSGSYAALLAVVGAAPVRTLRIESGGGEVTNAIQIARWIHGRGMNVIVDGTCFSSCSNYIFPAGREKHIVAGGIVGWHGTIEHLAYMQRKGLRAADGNGAMYEEIAAKERAFYADVGVNGFISWFGKIAPYNTPNLYFLSADDMAYFGLTGLHVRADYVASDLAPFNAEEKDTIRLLSVNRSVTNSSDPNWISR